MLEPDPTIREFFHELAEEFLHWDGKLGRTFRLLVTRPGALTKEYLAGRRIGYISPLRVYLTCSVLFFFLSATIPETQMDAQGRPVHRGAVHVGQSTPRELAAIDSLGVHAPMPQRWWFAHLARALRSPDRLTDAVQSSIPRTMFVLVPLFAAMMGLAFRMRRRRYPQHLAFALHEHAVLFLGLTCLLATRLLPNLTAALVFGLPLAVGIAVHLVLAARAVYRSSILATLARLAVAGALYFAAFLGVLYGVFALTVLEF